MIYRHKPIKMSRHDHWENVRLLEYQCHTRSLHTRYILSVHCKKNQQKLEKQSEMKNI